MDSGLQVYKHCLKSKLFEAVASNMTCRTPIVDALADFNIEECTGAAKVTQFESLIPCFVLVLLAFKFYVLFIYKVFLR